MNKNELEEQLNQLQEQSEKHRAELMKIGDQRKVVEEKLSLLQCEEVLSIPYIMELNYRDIVNPFFLKVQDYLRQFKFIKAEGYQLQTNQILINTKLIKGLEVEEQYKEIEKFIPYIKPITETELPEENLKCLGVFEHTFCKNGIYQIFIGEKVYFTKTSYYNLQIVKTCDSLLDCLKFVIQKQYYEKREI